MVYRFLGGGYVPIYIRNPPPRQQITEAGTALVSRGRPGLRLLRCPLA
jgi:hypothetical protein